MNMQNFLMDKIKIKAPTCNISSVKRKHDDWLLFHNNF